MPVPIAVIICTWNRADTPSTPLRSLAQAPAGLHRPQAFRVSLRATLRVLAEVAHARFRGPISAHFLNLRKQ